MGASGTSQGSALKKPGLPLAKACGHRFALWAFSGACVGVSPEKTGFSALFGLAAPRLADQVIGDLQRALQCLGLGAGGEVAAVDAQSRHAVHCIGVLQLRSLARLGTD